MFNPDRNQVRRFFCDAWRRHRHREPVSPIEALAVDWITQHPEYHEELERVDEALAADYPPQLGRTNPFLHLSMHLAIAEQLQIDQPPGIRLAYETLLQRTGSAHEAAHEVMECLGQILWEAQRHSQAPSHDQYLACLRKRAGIEF